MPKNKKNSKAKDNVKTNGEQPPKPEGRPLVRAIRVTKEVLEGAKAYKQATGVSFYRLGLDAISEVLKREGYLKEPTTKA